MPSSHYFQIYDIMDIIYLLKPKSLLDIGIGFGKYGFLSREYLELWDGRGVYGNWKVRIDGIEAYKDYVTPLHNLIYNNILIGDASELVPRLDYHYDLVLLIDVLEHFNRDIGTRLLENILKVSDNVLISTPLTLIPQEAAFGNEFEKHKSLWSKNDLKRFGKIYVTNNKLSLICLLGKDADEIKNKRRREALSNIVYCNPVYRYIYNWYNWTSRKK